jgi:CUB domain
VNVHNNCYHQVVRLTFQPSFRTESGNDFVKLYDGYDNTAPLLASLSGSSLPVSDFYSTQQYMFITFTSDRFFSNVGFNATYASIAPFSTTTTGIFWFTSYGLIVKICILMRVVNFMSSDVVYYYYIANSNSAISVCNPN